MHSDLHSDSAVSAQLAKVPNYMRAATFITLFMMPPIGIVALIHAAQVHVRLANGDHQGAHRSSRAARWWCAIAVVVWLAVVLPVIFGVVKDRLTP